MCLCRCSPSGVSAVPRRKRSWSPIPSARWLWGMQRDTSGVFGLPGFAALPAAASRRIPWHALRHTFASHFIMAGGNILTLQKIPGTAT